MRLLLSALAAAGIIGFSMVGFAADPGEPYTAKPKIDKPGRAIDDGTVQVGKPKKYGREIDDGTVQVGKPKKYGREIDDGSVKVGKPKKYGREIDDGSVKVGKPKKYGREIDDQKKPVKAKGAADAPGRAVDESKK
jgi:hypothetical protein